MIRLGAPARRPGARRGGRGDRTRGPSADAKRRRLLYRRRQSQRRMVGICRPHRWLDQRRLEIRRADDRACSYRQIEWQNRDLHLERMERRDRSGLAASHRWRTSHRSSATLNRRSNEWGNSRCRSEGRNSGGSRGAPRAWTNLGLSACGRSNSARSDRKATGADEIDDAQRNRVRNVVAIGDQGVAFRGLQHAQISYRIGVGRDRIDYPSVCTGR